jgi:hypothetical protein
MPGQTLSMDVSPSVGEYADRSPKGMRAGLGAALRSARHE